MKIIQTKDFKNWLSEQVDAIKSHIALRMNKIEYDEHFGDVKYLGNKLSELRWKNGLRVYFSRTGERMLLFLIGGNKNEQKKNIKKARILISRYADS
jgi:putative addiction module killer protein